MLVSFCSPILKCHQFISELCTDSSDQWVMISPKDIEAATCAPSSCAQHFCSTDSVPVEHVKAIGVHLDHIFKEHAHHHFTWNEFFMDAILSLSPLLLSFKKHPTESNVKSSIILPVLTEVCKRVSLLPNTRGTVFNAHIIPEEVVELHCDVERTGRKPGIDYLISFECARELIFLLPIEAKLSINVANMKQLASYLQKLSTAPSFQGKSMLGIVMTATTYVICIQMLKDDDERSLPITYVSPVIRWRSPDENIAITNTLGMILLCTLHLFKMDRVSPSQVFDPVVSQVVKELYKAPYNPDFSSHTLSSPLQDVMKEVCLLREQDRKLREEDKKLREEDRKLKQQIEELVERDQTLSERIEELEKQVDVLSPKKRKPNA